MSDESEQPESTDRPTSGRRRVVRRSSQLRSKPISTMPASQSGDNEHTIYTQIASLQIAKARQQKIKDSLLDQVAQCDEAIARAEQEVAQLMERAGIESVPKDGRRQAASTSAQRDDEPDDSDPSDFHYQY